MRVTQILTHSFLLTYHTMALALIYINLIRTLALGSIIAKGLGPLFHSGCSYSSNFLTDRLHTGVNQVSG